MIVRIHQELTVDILLAGQHGPQLILPLIRSHGHKQKIIVNMPEFISAGIRVRKKIHSDQQKPNETKHHHSPNNTRNYDTHTL